MQVIKKFFLTLYIIFLGVIVFCNTSVFADEQTSTQISVFQTSSDFSDYFVSMQDNFDFSLLTYKDRQGFKFFYNSFINPSTAWATRPTWNYLVESVSEVPGATGSGTAKRGWVITIYAASQSSNLLANNTDFQFINFNDYNTIGTFQVPTVVVNGYWKIGIYNSGNSYSQITWDQNFNYNCPFSILNYSHPLVNDYILNSNTNGASQVTSAIQQQTNTIKEESQKQQNAVATATQKQTNELLDTNNTGNETMSVNDTTTDTSADLSSIYNNISSAFTTYDPTISWGKDFVFTLPNGDNFTINLDSSLILNFLDDYPVLKAFYQSIFWVIFGGYVIFDFKKIINKMKEGNIDNVVGTSSPVDSVVNMSLK